MTQLLEQASETEVRGESGVAGTENVTAGTPPRRRRRAKLRSLQSWDQGTGWDERELLDIESSRSITGTTLYHPPE